MDEFLVTMEYERRLLRNNRIITVVGNIDDCSAHDFIEDIHVLLCDKSIESIKVIIASLGGEVFSGMAMIRALRKVQERGIKILGEVHGYACSMSFFLLQCCDERRMGILDMLMAHGITTGFTGDIKNIEAETKLLTFWNHELAVLVADRCIGKMYKEPGFWYEVLRDNTPQWYNAKECKKMGLIDIVD